MNYAIAAALLGMLCLLTLVSYVDRVYTEIGKFLSREFQDNIASFEQNIEPRLGVSRARASLSMAVLTQVVMAAIAMLVGFAVFRDRAWSVYEILQATLSLVLIVILFNRFLPFLFFTRTNGAWLARWVPLLKGLIYLTLPLTLVLWFLQSVTALTKEHSDEQPETQADAVDALIEAGQHSRRCCLATTVRWASCRHRARNARKTIRPLTTTTRKKGNPTSSMPKAFSLAGSTTPGTQSRVNSQFKLEVLPAIFDCEVNSS